MNKPPLCNPNGITVRELKEWLRDWPETNPTTGDEYDVWLATGDGRSSPCTAAVRLNRGDIYLET